MSLSIAANVRKCTSFFEKTEQPSQWITLLPNSELWPSQIKRPNSRREELTTRIILVLPRVDAHLPQLPVVTGLEEELPMELKALADALNESRWMLDLRDNWDDEGSPSYAQATWERAARFLINSAKFVQDLGLVFAIPKVQNGPEGTIDLYWETPDAKLLLNIPTEWEAPANYYGHKADGSETRGSLNTAHIEPWLMLWTARPTRK